MRKIESKRQTRGNFSFLTLDIQKDLKVTTIPRFSGPTTSSLQQFPKKK